jgi:hypothetical protein
MDKKGETGLKTRQKMKDDRAKRGNFFCCFSFGKSSIVLKKAIALLLPVCLNFLFNACDSGHWLDVRRLCEGYNKAMRKTGQTLAPEDFFVETSGQGARYQANLSQDLLLTLDTLPNDRIHTYTITGAHGIRNSAFSAAAAALLQIFTGETADQCARWLHMVNANREETLGFAIAEDGGFRFSYTANDTGRNLRVSALEIMPAEADVPTLRAQTTTQLEETDAVA